MVSFIKNIINYIKDDNNISIFLVRKIFNLRYQKISKILKIKSQEELCGELLVDSLVSRSYLPIEKIDSVQDFLVIKTPKIKFFKLSDVLIHPDSSCIVYKNKIYKNGYDNERFNEGFIKWHNNYYGKLIFNRLEEIEEGFFLGGNGSWNWYHYMIEILPKFLLFNNLPKTLLVSEVVLQFPTMQSVLDIFLQNKSKIVYLKRNTTYHVKSLLYINDFNHLQFNRFDDKILGIGTFFNTEILNNFSNYILNYISNNTNFPERVFLYRKNTHRMASNQDDLKIFLESQGFISICMEEINFYDQVNVFRNAKFIIGISGAAWTNLIFCRNNPKAICFIPENAKEFSAFSNLSKIFNVDFYVNIYKNNEYHYSNNFEIDMNEFKIKFNQLNDK